VKSESSRIVLELTVLLMLGVSFAIPVAAANLLGPTEPISFLGQGKPFTNDDVLKMVRAGFDPATIVEAIGSSVPGFDTSADALVALKEAGVSEEIIVTMLAATRPKTSPPTPDNKEDGLPEEVGIYFEEDGIYVPLPVEPVEWRSGFFGGTTTIGSLTKTKLNARLPSLHSPLELSGDPEFLVVSPQEVVAIDYRLIRARDAKDKREFRVVFQVLRGGLWVAEGGSGEEKVPFQAEQLGPQKFRLKLPRLAEGEYGFLPPTTGGNKSTLSVAKMYTFRVLSS